MKKIILVSLLSMFMLTGCFNSKLVKVSAEPIERAPLVVPSVDPYTNREVKWIIVTPENADQVFREMQEKGQSLSLFALTGDGYKSLSLNTADQIKISKQHKAIIEAYRKYYVEQNEILDKKEEERKGALLEDWGF